MTLSLLYIDMYCTVCMCRIHVQLILLLMTGEEFFDQFMVIGSLVVGVCIIVAVIVVAMCYCVCCKNGKLLSF